MNINVLRGDGPIFDGRSESCNHFTMLGLVTTRRFAPRTNPSRPPQVRRRYCTKKDDLAQRKKDEEVFSSLTNMEDFEAYLKQRHPEGNYRVLGDDEEIPVEAIPNGEDILRRVEEMSEAEFVCLIMHTIL